MSAHSGWRTPSSRGIGLAGRARACRREPFARHGPARHARLAAEGAAEVFGEGFGQGLPEGVGDGGALCPAGSRALRVGGGKSCTPAAPRKRLAGGTGRDRPLRITIHAAGCRFVAGRAHAGGGVPTLERP
ncbi:MAG: hypothetical protein LC119_16285 [Burkholderiales bacterium]|nr:hypothetical protein [Burkholderiales bacterium]